MKHTLLIYDNEIEYAKKAAAYINSKEGFPFEVRFISDDMTDMKDSRVEEADIVMASKDRIKDVLTIFPREKLLILSDEIGDTDHDTGQIYKYRNMDTITKEILQHAALRKDLNKLVSRKNQMKMIGLFSPVGRSGRTKLGLVLGQILAKNYRTLYVDMECYSNVSVLLNVSFPTDLSDLLYSVSNSSGDISALIGGASVTVGALDVMPSMRRHSDLISISREEWSRFFAYLESGTDYEYVILDLSVSIQGLMSIVSMCNRVIVTGIEDPASEKKINELNSELMEIEEYEHMIIHINLPLSTECEDIYNGGNGILGERAKDLIKEIMT